MGATMIEGDRAHFPRDRIMPMPDPHRRRLDCLAAGMLVAGVLVALCVFSYDPADPETNTMCDHKGERLVYYILAIAAILAFVAYFWVRHARLGY